ncbi:hypothetical protein FO519_010198, partial [Halicephalobus sp. NKZ332]
MFKTVITASAHAQTVPAQNSSDVNAIRSNKAILEIIKNFKPDLVFFVNSYNAEEFFDPIVGPIEKDQARMAVDNMLKFISQYTRSIIMNLPNFRYPTEVGPEYVRRKKLKKEIGFRIRRKSIREAPASINHGYKRVEAINCPKCIFWDYQDALCGDNYCNPIDSDTELPLLRDYGHVNILGLRR